MDDDKRNIAQTKAITMAVLARLLGENEKEHDDKIQGALEKMLQVTLSQDVDIEVFMKTLKTSKTDNDELVKRRIRWLLDPKRIIGIAERLYQELKNTQLFLSMA